MDTQKKALIATLGVISKRKEPILANLATNYKVCLEKDQLTIHDPHRFVENVHYRFTRTKAGKEAPGKKELVARLKTYLKKHSHGGKS